MILVPIPLAYIFSFYTGMEIACIWTAIITGIVLQAVLLFRVYRSGGRKQAGL
jgi:Na+-driven multidrug efflux pump